MFTVRLELDVGMARSLTYLVAVLDNDLADNRARWKGGHRFVDEFVDIKPSAIRGMSDSVGKRQPGFCSRSINNPALAIAEHAPGGSIQRYFVNCVRLRGGHIKSVVLKAQMPQSLLGDCCERRNRAFRIDLQHLVVTIIDDIQISLRTKANPVWTLEKIALCE
jgi:hypothetical protein